MVIVASTLSSSGAFATFEDPSAGEGILEGTSPCCINDAGAIVGGYTSEYSAGNPSTGFVRSPSGTFSSFSAGVSTYPNSTNATGDIAGSYTNAAGAYNGFVRSASGQFATFAAPGAGPGSGQGTVAQSINDAGAVTGFYVDSASVYHGFILEP
jgi:hypothetical protein